MTPSGDNARDKGTVLHISGGDGDRTHYLLHAMQALYQLSYAPKGKPTISAGLSSSPHYPWREYGSRRHAEAAVHADTRERDRAQVAGPLGDRARVLDTEPQRAPVRGSARTRVPAASLRARHVPVSEWHRPPRRPSARLHRHRRVRALPANERVQRAARDGLRRVRSAGRAVRGADRYAPAYHHRAEHRHHTSASCGRSVLGHDPRRGITTTDVSYYRWTQWIFLQIYNSWYDDEADRARPIAQLVQEFRAGRFPRPTTFPSTISARWSSASSSTRSGSRTSPKRRSTGARVWAPCSPTKR